MAILIMKAKIFEVTCRICESELRYEYADLRHDSGNNARDGSWSRSWLVCPVCQNEITTKSD
jgi:hypothetical protein